ncbi:hypothetical protein KY290_027383 [Solanum tuberosum]|uniref:DUF4283 domain-containing protein n=1 Tax=Solanum tuberosum TaxID=4113 RepID=A0ABQ7UET3_SOLTU|nr:hypothetical protein KY290_027383 [Solanum tuberosum]
MEEKGCFLRNLLCPKLQQILPYISLINIKGRRKAIIIIPELTLDSSWSGIAEKIGRFLSSHKYRNNRPTEDGTSKRGDKICINDDANSYSDVLKKSLVGKSVIRKGEAPILVDIRRWANEIWKQIHGVNIYEMENDYFLFEFSSTITTEQVVEGDYIWKNSLVLFQWWRQTICTLLETNRTSTTWIRIVGSPFQFWSQRIFKDIRYFCGGWIETEEKTQLKNHLQWARIKVEGEDTKIPKEVTIDDENLQHSTNLD